MLVIVASRWDPGAPALAARWAKSAVRILTPRDLSVAGWRLRSAGRGGAMIVAGGESFKQREVTGVLTRLPSVAAQELAQIAPEDRRYVASEMTAFLLFWLSQLRCPVLNRPSASSLCGPYWRREKWVHLAAQAGIRVRPVRRTVNGEGTGAEMASADSQTTVTVVGERTLGDAGPALHRAARRIARLAGVELLAVGFSGPGPDAEFLAADTVPDLSGDEPADAVLEYLGAAQAARA